MNVEDESDSVKSMTTVFKIEFICNILSFSGWINFKIFVLSVLFVGKSVEVKVKFMNSICVSLRLNVYLVKLFNFFDDNFKFILNSKN